MTIFSPLKNTLHKHAENENLTQKRNRFKTKFKILMEINTKIERIEKWCMVCLWMEST